MVGRQVPSDLERALLVCTRDSTHGMQAGALMAKTWLGVEDGAHLKGDDGGRESYPGCRVRP